MTTTTTHLHLFLLLSVITAIQIPTLQSLTLESDVFALISFKYNINPNSINTWSCLATWNFSVDPCSPHHSYFICGLSCTPDSTRIAAIALDQAGYRGRLSPRIANLTQLTHLDLSSNSFYGSIPSTLSSLTNLQTLSLSSNSFTGSLPSLSNLTSLQSLDLAHNSLQQKLPSPLPLPSSLTLLDLSFNKLTGGLPKLPPNLVQLAMKGNFLFGFLGKTSFDGLTRLEVVDLSSNRFSGNLGGWFFLLPSLQQVNLANNSFTGIEVFKAGNSGSNQLVAVDLGFNSIEGFLPLNLTTIPNLSALSLRYNKFRGPISWEFGERVKNGRLRRLFLDGNYLNGKLPAGFFGFSGDVTGSLGDNCLESCPESVGLCRPSQKPASICRRVYGGRS